MEQDMGLTVINRNGEQEDVRFDAILEKLNRLAMGLDTDWVDTALVAKRVIRGLYDGVTTKTRWIGLRRPADHER